MTTILLIEDDLWLAELYRDVLQAVQCQVHHARDAMMAMTLLDEYPIDIIVLDLLLPQHNGIALLQQLRSFPDLASIPVIIHSATPMSESGILPETWEPYGIVEYLCKTNSRPQDLARAVQRVKL